MSSEQLNALIILLTLDRTEKSALNCPDFLMPVFHYTSTLLQKAYLVLHDDSSVLKDTQHCINLCNSNWTLRNGVKTSQNNKKGRK